MFILGISSQPYFPKATTQNKLSNPGGRLLLSRWQNTRIQTPRIQTPDRLHSNFSARRPAVFSTDRSNFPTMRPTVFLALFKLPDPRAIIYVQSLLKFPTWGVRGRSKGPPHPVVPPSGITLIASLHNGYSFQEACKGFSNLVPRVSPLHAPGSERRETLVGAGHVSPKEKLGPGRGPPPASLCQDLLSTPKRGFRFAARSPRETHSTGYLFQWSSFCELL